MRRTEQRLAWALGGVALVLATAACSSPSTKTTAPPKATPAATATAPATRGFVSKRYAFRLALATQWSGTDAQMAWNGKLLDGLESPTFADFAEPGTGRAFTVGAAPVAKGMRLAAWRAAMVRAAPDGCVDSRSVAKTTLGGEPALAWTTNCGEGTHIDKIAAVHGTRGYMTIFEVNSLNASAADRQVLESLRRSFRFTT